MAPRVKICICSNVWPAALWSHLICDMPQYRKALISHFATVCIIDIAYQRHYISLAFMGVTCLTKKRRGGVVLCDLFNGMRKYENVLIYNILS